MDLKYYNSIQAFFEQQNNNSEISRFDVLLTFTHSFYNGGIKALRNLYGNFETVHSIIVIIKKDMQHVTDAIFSSHTRIFTLFQFIQIQDIEVVFLIIFSFSVEHIKILLQITCSVKNHIKYYIFNLLIQPKYSIFNQNEY